MAWDDGDKGNPWRSDKDKGPADLDAVVRDLQRRLAGLFRGGGAGRGGSGDQGLSGSLVASAVVIVAVVWASFGFYRVDAAERGVEFRFGAFQGLTQPGLQWHWPWPIERAEKINTGATERYPYESSMLTRDENIVNVSLVVQFRRTDPQKLSVQPRRAGEQSRGGHGQRDPRGHRPQRARLHPDRGPNRGLAQTQTLLQATLDSYGAGITMYEVNLVGRRVPRARSKAAVQDSIEAREDRERRILEAQTYSNEILPRARGEADGVGRTPRPIASKSSPTPKVRPTVSRRSSPSIRRRRP